MSNPNNPKIGKNHDVVSSCSNVILEDACFDAGTALGGCFSFGRLDRFAMFY